MKILHWNIENSGRGQNRRDCIFKIIESIIKRDEPDFVHICENCEGGGKQNYFSDQFALAGYLIPHMGAVIKNQRTQILFFKKQPNEIKNDDSYRLIKVKYNNHEFPIDLFIFVHLSRANSRLLNNTVGSGSFFAIGDWNDGNEYKKVNFGRHSSSLKNRTHSLIIPDKNKKQMEIALAGKADINLTEKQKFINSTLLSKKKNSNGLVGYDYAGWNDFFITNQTDMEFNLYHYSFSASVLESKIGGKKSGISPSNHVPIMIEIIRPQQFNYANKAIEQAPMLVSEQASTGVTCF